VPLPTFGRLAPNATLTLIVVDASAIVDWLITTFERGAAVVEEVRKVSALHTLDFADLEVMSGLRRRVARGELDEPRASEALEDFAIIRMRRHRASPFRRRIWELRHNHTPYDAAYLALAEALDMPLLTTDSRLARSGGHRARIIEAQ